MAFRSPPSSNPVSPILNPTGLNISTRIPPLSLTSEGAGAAPSFTLVIPTVRAKSTRRIIEAVSPKTGRPYPNRLRAHKPSHSVSIDILPSQPVEDNWVSPLGKFDIEQDATELEGYQMYAVEKWVVDRARFMKVVIVYTGNPKDVITVTVITPSSTLTVEQSQAEYDNAVKMLRRDGARPRQTVLGTIMCTSLANFRSDLNIVNIPGGHYLQSRDKLYVNINLLRLGCSGRTALTLDPPNESIQERLKQLYSIPAIAVQRLGFETVVLSFVKLIQSALCIYDFYDSNEERNGLLGDHTVDSIQRWTLEIGEKLRELNLQPSERILDPPIVASILSVVVSMRSKLLGLLPAGANVPKDPFQYPDKFTEALAQASPAHMTRLGPSGVPRAYLSAALIDHINRQHKRKTVEAKSYRIGIGPLAAPNALASLIPSSESMMAGSSKSAPDAVAPETSDLIAFVKSPSVISKDPIESLQLIWTGKLGPGLTHAKQAQEVEEKRLAEERDAENKSDAKSGEDEESMLGKGFSVLRQTGQEITARLNSLPVGGRRKQSMDVTSSPHFLYPPSLSSARPSPEIGGPRRLFGSDLHTSPFIPDEARTLSADEGMPRHRKAIFPHLGIHSALTTSNFSMGNYHHHHYHHHPPSRHKAKSLDFEPTKRTNPVPEPGSKPQQRIIPPTLTALEVHSEDEYVPKAKRRSTEQTKRFKIPHIHKSIQRRRSFDDTEYTTGTPLLSSDQMRIDVQFAASLIELQRRKRRLQLAHSALQELMRPLALTREVIKAQMNRQSDDRNRLDATVDEILPAVEDLNAIRALPLRARLLSSNAIPRDAPFKVNAVIAAETLKSSKYKASAEIPRIPELQKEVKKHREQFWQQRRLAYLPPETKMDEEDLTLALGSKCPFLWSLQTIYKLMLLAILWAGMLRRGEIHSSTDDGWRRSTVFNTRLDLKGRTQPDIDKMAKEEEEDKVLEWRAKAQEHVISGHSFAQL
ncbi:SubName: Full=Related to SIN3 protein-binding protein STB2 {ECO:0000313/EMBL:CCA69064.1} [Serendipita indica DSM 11827]|uniref:Related to SIN3 protein-binding protein STB2 n=1 Tax=Serendipita indica (strain DSM 11827) TaxID=1109443 RepID=G4TCN5_SERID|nr:SubName: Full=Related to SIN3 protein-binding protein STB2 {ECO:0000313/EMBL:CCA69064.1} [Serendipita indica DSM 11827]CCA69064.1 related to SIN3 protein-binding protein STB2 [Serendipita indica DSM 11827]